MPVLDLIKRSGNQLKIREWVPHFETLRSHTFNYTMERISPQYHLITIGTSYLGKIDFLVFSDSIDTSSVALQYHDLRSRG